MNVPPEKADCLINFQEITGITDTDCAIDILNQFHWDIDNAIEQMCDFSSPAQRKSDSKNTPSTLPLADTWPPDVLRFNLTLKENPAISEQLLLPNSSTVYDLKQMFVKGNLSNLVQVASKSAEAFTDTETGIIDILKLEGLHGHDNPSNNATLRSFNLPQSNDVTLTFGFPIQPVHGSDGNATINNPDMTTTKQATGERKSNSSDSTYISGSRLGNSTHSRNHNNHKTPETSGHSTTTVIPANATPMYDKYRESSSRNCVDNSSMSTDNNTSMEPGKPRNQRSPSFAASDNMANQDTSDYHDFDDDDLEMVTDGISTADRLPLIPLDMINSPADAISNFSIVFTQRYCTDGSTSIPPFNVCSFQEALDASFKTTRLEERKPLFIYLHNDNSVAVNIFCERILCSADVGQFFQANEFTIWPWDVTQEPAKEKLLQWLAPRLEWLANEVRLTPTDNYPMLVMIGKFAGSLDVLTMLTSNGINSNPYSRTTSTWTSIEDEQSFPSLGATLGHTHNFHSSRMRPHLTQNNRTLVAADVAIELWEKLAILNQFLEPELQTERDRMQRECMLAEQDKAYLESLSQDRQKLQAKENEKQEQKRLEEQAIMEAREEKNKAANRRANAALALPSEPPEGSSDITTLRFRLPPDFKDGNPLSTDSVVIVRDMIVRRFRATECLKDLKNYMESLGFDTDHYKLLTTYPRTDLSALTDDQMTLTYLKLVPQETLVLEQR